MSHGTSYPCPSCDSRKAAVLDSRTTRQAKRRRRECECGERFTTYEIEETALGDVLEKAKLFDEISEKISTVGIDIG